MTILHYEAVAGDGWYAIARKLGGSQASQDDKDANANYLAAANGYANISTGVLYRGQIVFYNPDKLITATAPPKPPGPPARERIEAVDFAQANQSGLWAPLGLVDTDVTFKPGSSTKASQANAGSTNPLRVVRVGEMSAPKRVNDPVVRNVTVDATGVGHNSHGLTVGYSRDAVIDNVKVIGFRGTGSSPPQETFGLETWQCEHPTVRGCTVLGAPGPSGTLFGANSCTDLLVEDCVLVGSTAAFGAAIWQVGNFTLRRVDLSGNRRAFNSEQSWGEIELDHVDVSGMTNTTNPHIVISTDNPNGGTVEIIEPQWTRTRPLTIGVPPNVPPYNRGGVREDYPATIRPEHVVVIIDGKSYKGPQNTSLLRIGNYWG